MSFQDSTAGFLQNNYQYGAAAAATTSAIPSSNTKILVDEK